MHVIQRFCYSFGHCTLNAGRVVMYNNTLNTVRQMTSLVLATETSDKGMLIINHPKMHNAITLDMIRKITKHLKKCEKSKSLMIIKGMGDKAFSAGGDIRALVEAGANDYGISFVREGITMNAIIATYKIPYVALIDGITMGAGVGISVHGKYRVATERTLFAMPETAIGLFPDVGGSYFLPRMEGKLGWYLGLTGHRLRSEDVQKAGVATHFCHSSKLDQLEEALLNCNDVDEVPNILQSFHSPSTKEFSLQPVLEKINRNFTANSIEEIFENLKNDGSEWATKTLNVLNRMCPTSLKVTFHELQYGVSLSILECFEMEYVMTIRHLQDSEFKKGVRALLVDKDKQPKWNPSTLDAVKPERVQWFFEKLPHHMELKLQLDRD